MDVRVIPGVLNGEFAAGTVMAGDFVQAKNCTDPLVKDGTYGVIQGPRNQPLTECSILWRPSPYPWGGGENDEYVTSSGGPDHLCPIPVAALQPTGNTIEQVFAVTKNQDARNPEKVLRRVRVFLLDFATVSTPWSPGWTGWPEGASEQMARRRPRS